MESDRYCWSPQPGPQSDACATASFCDELFYGGAVFGGKTQFLLGDFASDVDQGSDWVGILFRQSFPELEEIIECALQIFPQMGAEYQVGTKTWRWPDGAVLRLRSLDSINDFTKYMGFSYSWIGWDELPLHETMKPYHRMKSRLRGPARNKRIRATGNPGGRCHAEIKEYFQINTHKYGYHLIRDDATKTTRMFIPSKVKDNRIGLQADPGYIDRLRGVGDPELIKGWLEGDWDAIVGAYFSMFRRSEVEEDSFEIPEGWAHFTCMDYGESMATWCGLLAVDSDWNVYVVDEYYREDAGGADHARGVLAMLDNYFRLRKDRCRLHLAPHDMWTKRKPGEATQAAAPVDSFVKQGIHLTRANMERVNGARNVKDLLYAGRLKFFRGKTEHVLESLGTVMRDPHDPEDVLKGGNDHPYDGLRYGINHVYKPRPAKKKTVTAPNTGKAVLDALMQMDEQGRAIA